MSDLWFTRELSDISRRGTMLFASCPGEVWAVLTEDLVYADDHALESDQLLGSYGALASGVGHLLLGAGVQLPSELKQWATARDRPAADLGGWAPGLVLVDALPRLALSRDFDGLRVFATTLSGQHLGVVVPPAETIPALVMREVDAPVPGWDQHGGEPSSSTSGVFPTTALVPRSGTDDPVADRPEHPQTHPGGTAL